MEACAVANSQFLKWHYHMVQHDKLGFGAGNTISFICCLWHSENCNMLDLILERHSLMPITAKSIKYWKYLTSPLFWVHVACHWCGRKDIYLAENSKLLSVFLTFTILVSPGHCFCSLFSLGRFLFLCAVLRVRGYSDWLCVALMWGHNENSSWRALKADALVHLKGLHDYLS